MCRAQDTTVVDGCERSARAQDTAIEPMPVQGLGAREPGPLDHTGQLKNNRRAPPPTASTGRPAPNLQAAGLGVSGGLRYFRTPYVTTTRAYPTAVWFPPTAYMRTVLPCRSRVTEPVTVFQPSEAGNVAYGAMHEYQFQPDGQ